MFYHSDLFAIALITNRYDSSNYISNYIFYNAYHDLLMAIIEPISSWLVLLISPRLNL